MSPTINTLPNFKKINKKNALLSLFLLFIISLIIIKPNMCISSIYNGLSVWATCVLPSLLPFMFFTKLLTNLDYISRLTSKFYKFTHKLFCAPKISAYVFFMSIISGYPVGAKIISDFYEMRIISQRQANKLCTFCSTSGPLFIIGSVGAGMFKDISLGYIIFLSHILSSILNGIVFRKAYVDMKFDRKNNILTQTNQKDTQNILQNSMIDSILSVLIVGGYIAIAFLVIDLFNDLNLLYPINYLLELCGLKNGTAAAISSGFLEVSKGCLMLSTSQISKCLLGTIASFLIGFGGISIFLQATTFLTKSKINLKFYFVQKLTHGMLSAIITFLLCLLTNV